MTRLLGLFQMALTIPLSSFIIWFLNRFLPGELLTGSFLHIMRDMSFVTFVICLTGATAYNAVFGFARVFLGDDL